MQFADRTLAKRLEAADAAGGVDFARAHARLHPAAGATSMPVAGGHAIFAGIESPVTQVIGLGLEGTVADFELQRMEEFLRNRGAPVNLELCPLADASLLEALTARGYRLVEHSNVLIRPLNPDDCETSPSSDVQVREIAGDEIDLWAGIVAKGFFEDQDVPPAVLQDLETFFNMSTSTCFIAGVDERPAGGGVVATHKGVASLFGHSTLPAFRNRGVQTAIIRPSLAVAAKTGCDLAMACTLPGSTSQRNLERHGFSVAYTRSRLLREFT